MLSEPPMSVPPMDSVKESAQAQPQREDCCFAECDGEIRLKEVCDEQAPAPALNAPALPCAADAQTKIKSVTCYYASESAVPTDWMTRRSSRPAKQLMNVLFFGACSALNFYAAQQLNQNAFVVFGTAFAFMAGLAFIYSVFHRSHISCEDELPFWLRKNLRRAALLTPFAASLLGCSFLCSQSEFQKGEDLYNQKQYKDAANHYQLAVMTNPLFEKAHLQLAHSYNQVWDYPRALRNASFATQLEPSDAEAWGEKAWALNALDRYHEALPDAQKAIALDPDNGQAHASIATAYRALGDFNNALTADNQHVRLHYDERRAYEERAETLQGLGRQAEAQADLDYAKTLAAD